MFQARLLERRFLEVDDISLVDKLLFLARLIVKERMEDERADNNNGIDNNA